MKTIKRKTIKRYLREKSNNGMETNVTAKYVNKQNEALVRS